jgi:hypothetical protein
MLIPDAKKETLWLAYTPFAQPWRMRPCFIETPAEKKILDTYRKEGVSLDGDSIRGFFTPIDNALQ